MHAFLRHRQYGRFALRHLILVVIFLLLFFPLQYLLLMQDDAFRFAENFARTDSEITRRVGNISNVTLRFWDGFELNADEAKFVFGIQGDKETAGQIVNLQLRRVKSGWQVKSAFLTAHGQQAVSLIPASTHSE